MEVLAKQLQPFLLGMRFTNSTGEHDFCLFILLFNINLLIICSVLDIVLSPGDMAVTNVLLHSGCIWFCNYVIYLNIASTD